MTAPASKNVPEQGDARQIVPPERTTPALLMSLALHVLLLTSIGLIWSRQPHGTGQTEDRPVGIALVHRLPDRDRYVDAAEAVQADQAVSDAAAQAVSAAAAPPADLSPPIDLAGVLKAMQSTPAPVSGSGLAGETKLDGDAFDSTTGSQSSGDAAETTTMLFGISPMDPTTLASAVGLLTVIAVAASYVPAHRATHVDPMQVLRNN